jgi:hypothetical protein
MLTLKIFSVKLYFIIIILHYKEENFSIRNQCIIDHVSLYNSLLCSFMLELFSTINFIVKIIWKNISILNDLTQS